MRVGFNSYNMYNNSPKLANYNSESNQNIQGYNSPAFGLGGSKPIKLMIPIAFLLFVASFVFSLVNINSKNSIEKSLDKLNYYIKSGTMEQQLNQTLKVTEEMLKDQNSLTNMINKLEKQIKELKKVK